MICVCYFRDCALVNSIIGTKHRLYCAPLYFSHTQYPACIHPPTPLLCARHHTIYARAISCKGQHTVCIYSGGLSLVLEISWGGGARTQSNGLWAPQCVEPYIHVYSHRVKRSLSLMQYAYIAGGCR